MEGREEGRKEGRQRQEGGESEGGGVRDKDKVYVSVVWKGEGHLTEQRYRDTEIQR